MVRTQLYLSDETYEFAKEEAEKRNMSFAAFSRLLYDKAKIESNKKMSIQERYPFIGMFKGGRNDSDNDAIDEFLVNQHGH